MFKVRVDVPLPPHEKRADIHRIESRLKVAITMIQTRIWKRRTTASTVCAWDDLTADVLQASYMLVEKPAEKKAADLRTRTAKSHPCQSCGTGHYPHNRHR